ncbi:MAG: FecR domain-containing protein [Bacteroidota bacterium]
MNQKPQDIDENLLLQYLLGNANDELRTSVETWLDADSGSRQRLDQLESLWLETGKLSPAPVAVDVGAAWTRMSQRIERAESSHSAPVKGKIITMQPFRYLLRVAAVLILLIGIYVVFKLVNLPVKKIELSSGTTVLRDTLPDGTKVTLNKNSRLTYPLRFDQGNREVMLTGEGFFEVKHDEVHPFIVDAGPAKVRVLGTSFSVRAIPAMVKASRHGADTPPGVGDQIVKVEVNVTEGRVMLFRVDPKTGDTASLLLISGETGIWSVERGEMVRIVSAIPDGTFWANRSLEFRGTALSEVISIIEKYYPVKITVSDPAILNCRLNASFANEPAIRMISVIAESFGLKLVASGQNYHLTGHGCSNENN